ncbi:MAG: restriction endonuclease [Bacteroidota bacterium]|nr:restriction endonuclease [Bacteroidota bacterium]
MNNYKTSHQIIYGQRILPIKRVESFNPDEWEEFIEEWLDLKKSTYVDVERLGGAGDKGRDVIAYSSDKKTDNYSWDCFQCKHYDNALKPTQVYVEFGKIIYYSYLEEYPVPNNYYFIAPKGCGTSLSMLLQNKSLLKNKLIENWDIYCKDKITTIPIILTGEFLKYVEDFNYEIFSKIHTKDIIKEHRNHPNHLIRFGGGLPERKKITEKDIPNKIDNSESRYVNQLVLAYGSDCGESFQSLSDIETKPIYSNHFARARMSFHHAEQLRNFSRDSLPVGTFADFQNEILQGIIDIVEEEYESGFEKVKDAEKEARKIVISSNPLKDVSVINDRSGICHQLVNDGEIKWIDKDDK